MAVPEGKRKIMGLIIMFITMFGLGAVFIRSGLTQWSVPENTVTFTQIGEQMLTYYSPALIAMALTLAAAVIGALALAKIDLGAKESGSSN